VQAAAYCVHSDVQGVNDVSDWNNAFTKLPDKLERGSTYYIADGNYGSYVFDDPEDGEKYIYIKKAIESDHGTNAGWQSRYGDGVAVFSDTNSTVWHIKYSYWVFD